MKSYNEKLLDAFLEGFFGCSNFREITVSDNKKILDKINLFGVKNEFSKYYMDITEISKGYESSFCEEKTAVIVRKFNEHIIKDGSDFHGLFLEKNDFEILNQMV